MSIFFLIPDRGRRGRCERTWRDLLGDRVICLQSSQGTCIVSAVLLALSEGWLADVDAVAALLRIFEGAQGALLDEWRGFHPHTTWSTCTSEGALAILNELEVDQQTLRLGVTRSYATRHGAGPLPTVAPALDASRSLTTTPRAGRARFGAATSTSCSCAMASR